MPAVIGEGAYGKVYRPPKSCNRPYDLSKKVGKVFGSMHSYKEELQTMGEVKKINSKSEFSIPMYEACPEAMQIIYEDGGQDLYDYIKTRKPSEALMTRLLKQMSFVCRGLAKLSSHGYVHQDIKLENIVYNGKKMYLIDFGLMNRASDVYNHKDVLEYDYMAYPPEYKRYVKKEGLLSRFKKNFEGTNLLGHIRNYYKDMEKDLKSLASSPSYPTEKIDVYSLGIVLAYIYRWYNRSGKSLQEVEELIRGMVCMDPKKRLTAKQALARLDDIVGSGKHVAPANRAARL